VWWPAVEDRLPGAFIHSSTISPTCFAVERYNMAATFLNSVGLRCGKFGNYNVDKAEPVWGSRKDAVSWPQNPLNA
jgi:hypothetical protein